MYLSGILGEIYMIFIECMRGALKSSGLELLYLDCSLLQAVYYELDYGCQELGVRYVSAPYYISAALLSTERRRGIQVD
jgi:hypothetical protein